MRKERSARAVWPKYTPYQERRAKQQLERLERWQKEHQAPYELRLRELLKPQMDAWR
jgi:hypothetical protein